MSETFCRAARTPADSDGRRVVIPALFALCGVSFVSAALLALSTFPDSSLQPLIQRFIFYTVAKGSRLTANANRKKYLPR